LPPCGANLLITGPRGGGKSSLAKALMDRLAASRYQFCVVDPDGSYEALPHATSIGQGQEQLDLEAAVQLLSKPSQNAHISLVSLAAGARQRTFGALVTKLERLRATTGRPHWILVDDAEHLLPSVAPAESLPLPAQLDRVALITERPRRLSERALEQVDTLAIVGERPLDALADFCAAANRSLPALSDMPLATGEILYWRLHESSSPTRMRVAVAEKFAAPAVGISSARPDSAAAPSAR
jgi:hypothetical protein